MTQEFQSDSHLHERSRTRFDLLISSVILTAAAAGMGWGIRGQYGHETGAMIAGALAASVLVLLYVPHVSALSAFRTAALMTIGIGIGGQMTYGQTVGLTHDIELVGNSSAYWWGMLGLAIKGGVWIGFGGILLGLGLSGVKYRASEMLVLFLCLIGLMFAGIWLINEPYDPGAKRLPLIYFSDHWHFEPDKDLSPRRETWGGLLTALAAFAIYARFIRKDRLAGRMCLVGFAAGALGFPTGQSIQAFHAWHPEVFTEGSLSGLADYFALFNWWNMMETTFGLVWGAVMAAGLYWNRQLIRVRPAESHLTPGWEMLTLSIHFALLCLSEFVEVSSDHWLATVEMYTEYGLVMSTVPVVCVLCGRWWPGFMLLPVVAAPIAGKTFRSLVMSSDFVSPTVGWLAYVEIPLVAMTGVALWCLWHQEKWKAEKVMSIALLASTLCYFRLNSFVFHGAWPWQEWTARTPNQLIFLICAVVLCGVAITRLTIPRRPTTTA